MIREKEHRRPEKSPDHRVVVADDRVLDRVRQQEKDDEIEWIELRELTLPGEPKTDQNGPVDDESADGFLEQGNARDEDVVPDG